MHIKEKLTFILSVGLIALLASFHGRANKEEVSTAKLEKFLQLPTVDSPRRIDVVLVASNSSEEELINLSHDDDRLKVDIVRQINSLKRNPTADANARPYQSRSEGLRDTCVIVYSSSVKVNSVNNTTLHHEVGHCFQNYLSYDFEGTEKKCSTYGERAKLCEHDRVRNLWNRYNQEQMAELTAAILEFKLNGNFKWLNLRISDYEFKYNLPAYSLGKPLLEGFEAFVYSKTNIAPDFFDKMTSFQAIDYVHDQYFVPNALAENSFNEMCNQRQKSYKGPQIKC
jgi:hypothetical protein